MSLPRVRESDRRDICIYQFYHFSIALVLTFAMMISGTIYDIFIYQTYLKANTKTVVSKYMSN